MKVTGETFSFHHKRKGAEEARCQNHSNFQAKGPLPDRTLKSFIQKAPTGQLLSFRKTHTEFTLKNDFLISLGRIFQVKGQSKRVI